MHCLKANDEKKLLAMNVWYIHKRLKVSKILIFKIHFLLQFQKFISGKPEIKNPPEKERKDSNFLNFLNRLGRKNYS